MFQSYSYANGKWIIIDSDFQEVLVSNNPYWVEDIIEVYSRRNLNVALNIVLFMQYENRKYGDSFSIDNQISRYKRNIKGFEQYLPEINQIIQEEQNQIQVVNDFLEENNLSKYKSSSRKFSFDVSDLLEIISK